MPGCHAGHYYQAVSLAIDLQVAVQLVETQNVYEDSDIQNLVDEWREGLLDENIELFEEVLSRAEAHQVQLSAQSLAQMVRTCQQVGG